MIFWIIQMPHDLQWIYSIPLRYGVLILLLYRWEDVPVFQ